MNKHCSYNKKYWFKIDQFYYLLNFVNIVIGEDKINNVMLCFAVKTLSYFMLRNKYTMYVPNIMDFQCITLIKIFISRCHIIITLFKFKLK